MSVRRMPVPEHTVIAPEVMSENLRKILQDFPEPGLAVRDDATQHFALRWAGRTRAPFLCFCLEGRFELPAAGEQHPPFALKVGPGTGFLFSADTFVNSREQEIVKYLRITFDRDGTLFGITRRTVALQCDLGEGDLAIDACYVTSPRSTLADALLARLLEIPRADSALKAGSPVRELLRLLFHELSRHLLLRGESLHSGGAARYRAVRRYIEENCHLPIDRETTARAFGVSPETISRDFAEHSPSPFKRALLVLRLERARALLHDPRLTIEEVALRSGFSSLNYFSDAFRRATGQRPSQWRNQAG